MKSLDKIKNKSSEGKGIKQPCNNFKPNSMSEGYETTKYPHQCPICGGWRGFCLNCNKDHHENGWNSCKKQTKNCGIDYSKDNIFDAIGRPDLKPKEKQMTEFEVSLWNKIYKIVDNREELTTTIITDKIFNLINSSNNQL